MPDFSSALCRRRIVLGAVFAVVAGGLSLPGPLRAQASVPAEPVKVVATFSILGDMVREIGGDRVQITTLVGPEQDAHGYEPRPQDVLALRNAQVVVANGLGFETWLDDLKASAGFDGVLVVASQHARLRRAGGAGEQEHDDHGHEKHGHDKHAHEKHDHDKHEHHHEGEDDPHAWQDLQNGQRYVEAIAQGLAQSDPAGAGYYAQRANDYRQRMQALDDTLRQQLGALPAERRKVVSSHDAFGYFADAYGITFIPVSGLAGKAEVSARGIARLVDTVKKEKVSGVFVESGSSSRLVEQIARETDAVVGGTLYSDALARPGHPADTYLGIFRWNAEQLLQVLGTRP